MSWNKIYRIRDALLTVSKDVYHFEALKKKDKYIVWAEDGEGNSGHADNKKNQVIQGTIDYFTKDDADPVVEEIQEALELYEISYKLNSCSMRTKQNISITNGFGRCRQWLRCRYSDWKNMRKDWGACIRIQSKL